MSLRDWLLIGGGILLLIVVLDGLRRVRKRGSLRLDIDKNLGDLPEPDLSAELPNGGARPARAGVSRETLAEPSYREPKAASEPSRPAPSVPQQWEDEEIDLLLADDLQGVGQGADRWLADQEVEMEPLHAGSRRDEIAWEEDGSFDDGDPFGDDGEEAVGRPRPARASAPAAEPKAAAWADQTAPSPEQPSRADSQAEQSRQGPRLTLADKPTVPADGLDLSKPVPELVEQMASRSRLQTESPLPETDTEASAESRSDYRSESRVETVSELKVELENEPSESLVDGLALGGVEAEAPVEPEPLRASRDAADAPTLPGKEERQAPEESVERGRGRKGRKKKGRRGLPEIQINIFDAHPEIAPEPELGPQPSKVKETREEKPAKKASPEEKSLPDTAENCPRDPAEDVLVISVAARREPFQGNRLFKLLAACDLTFGEMDIFHRHEEPGGKGPVQFSMANAVKPGTFELSEPEQFRTPAVTFFLNMAEPRDLDNAFDCMLATAKCVAENLEGELKDENRSSLRPQTIEHCRQRIRDFKRRRLTRRA